MFIIAALVVYNTFVVYRVQQKTDLVLSQALSIVSLGRGQITSFSTASKSFGATIIEVQAIIKKANDIMDRVNKLTEAKDNMTLQKILEFRR